MTLQVPNPLAAFQASNGFRIVVRAGYRHCGPFPQGPAVFEVVTRDRHARRLGPPCAQLHLQLEGAEDSHDLVELAGRLASFQVGYEVSGCARLLAGVLDSPADLLSAPRDGQSEVRHRRYDHALWSALR